MVILNIGKKIEESHFLLPHLHNIKLERFCLYGNGTLGFLKMLVIDFYFLIQGSWEVVLIAI